MVGFNHYSLHFFRPDWRSDELLSSLVYIKTAKLFKPAFSPRLVRAAA
jgi:hypothetical protein